MHYIKCVNYMHTIIVAYGWVSPPPMWQVIAWSIWNALPQLHSIGVFSSTHQCSTVIATPNS